MSYLQPCYGIRHSDQSVFNPFQKLPKIFLNDSEILSLILTYVAVTGQTAAGDRISGVCVSNVFQFLCQCISILCFKYF